METKILIEEDLFGRRFLGWSWIFWLDELSQISSIFSRNLAKKAKFAPKSLLYYNFLQTIFRSLGSKIR